MTPPFWATSKRCKIAGRFAKIRVDITREGPSFIADMENADIENAEGVNFSVPRKSEMASLLKKRMQDGRFFYPMVSFKSHTEAISATS